MKRYHRIIDRQIDFNRGKNIFKLDDNGFRFSDPIRKALACTDHVGIDTDALAVYIAGKVMDEFYRVNQFYAFDQTARNELVTLYRHLLSRMQTKEASISAIERTHFRTLQHWLQRFNPFAQKIYYGADLYPASVPCAEYTAEFQLDLLGIDPNTILQPVLDIGCGSSGNLIKLLRSMGLSATGIDRSPSPHDGLTCAHWLEYSYGHCRWGTIVSNLGFSNHFAHHHLRRDGNYITYATKFMEILASLKRGGKFYYAPSLPFIESYLAETPYRVTGNKTGDYHSTVIERYM